MAEAEEMLHQEEALEEHEGLAEVEGRRLQWMEVITQIADLERERDRFTNRLRRRCNQTLSRFHFGRMEELYISLIDLDSALSLKISDWEELLETDQSVYPARGMPEF